MKVLDEKYILKLAARSIVPDVITRRSKQPYRAPDAKCFVSPESKGTLPDYAEALLAPARLAEDGIFNPNAVGQLLAKVRAGRAVSIRDNMAFVGVLSTQLVVDRFIRRAG